MYQAKKKPSRFKSSKELRKFAATMFVPLALFGGLFLWRKGLTPLTYVLFGSAGFFVVTGLIVPKLLGPIEWVWMKFAGVLGYVMTRVILTLTFFLAITPVGLLTRLLRRDPLQLRPRAAETYWVPVEPDGPGTRSNTPF